MLNILVLLLTFVLCALATWFHYQETYVVRKNPATYLLYHSVDVVVFWVLLQ